MKTNFPRRVLYLHTVYFRTAELVRFVPGFCILSMDRGGNMPCILNAANEIVVAEFLKDKIGFLEMSDIIEEVMAKAHFVAKPTYDDYVATDEAVRALTSSFIP